MFGIDGFFHLELRKNRLNIESHCGWATFKMVDQQEILQRFRVKMVCQEGCLPANFNFSKKI